MIYTAPLCMSYYKQNKLYRLVYDDSRQLEWVQQQSKHLKGRLEPPVSNKKVSAMNKSDIANHI